MEDRGTLLDDSASLGIQDMDATSLWWELWLRDIELYNVEFDPGSG